MHGTLAVIPCSYVVECDYISANNVSTAKWYMNDFASVRRARAGRRPDGSRWSPHHEAEAAGNPGRARLPAGRPTWQGKCSKPGVPVNEPEHSDIRARSSFALPRLLACYTALDRGRSAEPASSLLTELFRPPGPGCA